jgi:hypothetical protein
VIRQVLRSDTSSHTAIVDGWVYLAWVDEYGRLVIELDD